MDFFGDLARKMVVEEVRNGTGGRIRECECLRGERKEKKDVKDPWLIDQIRKDICECVVCGGEIRGRWVMCGSLKI